VFTKTKEAMYKFNHLFAPASSAEHPKEKLEKFRDGVRSTIGVKDPHILVRDYEIETDLKICLI
jgi:hypothetical protein